MSTAIRHLLRDLSFLILALLLATAVWIAATMESDPFALQEFPNVPITMENQPENTVLFEPVVEHVSITARAPESALAKLKPSDFAATMDLSAVQPGVPTSVPIEVTATNGNVRVQSWDPRTQLVHLERVHTITMTVTVEVRGQVAIGYQVDAVTVSPQQVSIHGPEPLLARVATLHGLVNVESARQTVTEDMRVRPLGTEGDLVPGLEWTPDQVEVQVSVSRRLGFKPDVQVVPELRGDPAPGFRLGSVAVDPPTVTLAGVPSVLEGLPGFVGTAPITVTDATQNLLERIRLTVPDNVVVVGVDFVTVTVEVLPIQSSRTMTTPVEVRGIRSGWGAVPSPDEVDVILEGPDATLSQMQPDDLKVILDLLGYSPGVYQVKPEVVVPEGVGVVSIIPGTIEVSIQPTPAVTETASPSSTP